MDKLRLLFFAGPAAWFGLKYYALGTLTWENSTKFGILLNFGFLTLVAAISTHRAYRLQAEDFIERWKQAARKTLSYALILPVVLGAWYYGIASDALESRIILKKEQATDQIMDDESFAQLAASSPQLLDADRTEIAERQHANIEVFFSPIFYIGMATLAWSFVGLILSAIFALIWPKIWSV
jgi:hypothetical protein